MAVRIRFGKQPYDLCAAIGYTLVVSAVLLVLDAGNYLAFLLMFFVPGYVLVAALFPAKTEIDWIERIALSFGLSLATVPLLGLLLSFTSLGVRFAPIVVGLASFTTSVGFAAWWRRLRLPVADRLAATLVLSLSAWRKSGSLDRLLALALATSMIVAVGTLAFVILSPSPGDRFSEFYLLGPGGSAKNYPTNLTPSQPGTVIIGIANHEGMTSTYTAQVDLIGIRVIFNATLGRNQTAEANRTTLSRYNVTLGNNQNWTQPFTFVIGSVGFWKMQFLLYREGVLINHPLQLWILVS